MRISTLTITAILFALFSIPLLGQEKSSKEKEGAKYFSDYCGLCHRLTATPVQPGLIWLYTQKVSDKELRSRIKDRATPLSAKQKNELFDYIRSFESDFEKSKARQ
ncbi:MAG: hypothetical protein WD898_03360 [Candidatus Paceibacterota bacterium]